MNILSLENVSKNYGIKPLFENVTLGLEDADKIGIIGANGSGKTTLLEIITNRIQPDSGEIETGQTVHVGYYDQESRALNEEQRVIDYIKEVAEYVTTADGTQITASQMLEKFLFAPSAQYSLIENLSGGERRRLYLLRILMAQPNVLLLDEPTNDLDIPTLIALEEYLDDFAGALIVVSHDRYFLDRAIDNIFKFEGEGKVRRFAGSYSAYLEIAERETAETRAESALPTVSQTSLTKAKSENSALKKLSFKEKREFEPLEANISEIEKRLAQIEQELNEFAADAFQVNKLFTEQQRLNERLEQAVERWAELAERADL